MRFHTTAVIHVQDAPKVMTALELALRDVTIEAIRSGNLMMLRGLGISSVSMNHDDFAILTVEENDDGVFIEADGVFDGSYLGSSTSPEEEVRSKLNRVFDDIQRQFEVDLRTPDAPVIAKMEVKPVAPAMVETAVTAEVKPVVPVMVDTAVAPIMVETAVKAEAKTVAPAVVGTEVKTDEAQKSGVQIERPDVMSFRALLDNNKGVEPKTSPSKFEIPKELPARRLTDIPHANFRHFSYLAVSVPVLVLAIAGIYGLERFLEQRENYRASPANSLPATTHIDSRAAASESPAISMPVPAPSSDHSTDPKTLLKRWEGAMRTRDAEAQSSFYADPVDRYQDQAFVTRAVLQQEKEAAIADRKGLWTVKLEGIVIEKRTDDEVNVRLVKHFIDQPGPSQIKEQLVPTQLVLKRVKGGWKIVSERDLAPLANPVSSGSIIAVEMTRSKFQS